MALNELREEKIALRDLKPENLVLDTKEYCIMVDFGLAKRCQEPTYTLGFVGYFLFTVIALFQSDPPLCPSLIVCGTPDYIAPEVIERSGHGLRVDYWALGVLMYARREMPV